MTFLSLLAKFETPQAVCLVSVSPQIFSIICSSRYWSVWFWVSWIRNRAWLPIRLRTFIQSSKNSKKNLNSYCFVISLWLFIFARQAFETPQAVSLVSASPQIFSIIWSWRCGFVCFWASWIRIQLRIFLQSSKNRKKNLIPTVFLFLYDFFIFAHQVWDSSGRLSG
jgi:hypothetical protein